MSFHDFSRIQLTRLNENVSILWVLVLGLAPLMLENRVSFKITTILNLLLPPYILKSRENLIKVVGCQNSRKR